MKQCPSCKSSKLSKTTYTTMKGGTKIVKFRCNKCGMVHDREKQLIQWGTYK